MRKISISAGFTLAEVVLALAVVAFGLIAVLGVLPIGLNTTRDNRDETMIVQDAEYWMHAIRGGRLGVESLNNVEWVQVSPDNETWYTAEHIRVALDPFAGELEHMVPPIPNEEERGAYIGQLKHASWRKDLVGWLSIKDKDLPFKRAKVRPLGGTLMNRLHSVKDIDGDTGKSKYRHEGGDLTFSYLLETYVKEDPENPGFWEIKLIAKWPILEEKTLENGEIDVKTGPGERTFVAIINGDPTITGGVGGGGAGGGGAGGGNILTHGSLSIDLNALLASLPPGEAIDKDTIMQFLLGELGNIDNGSEVLGLANGKLLSDLFGELGISGLNNIGDLMGQIKLAETSGSLFRELEALLGTRGLDLSALEGQGIDPAILEIINIFLGNSGLNINDLGSTVRANATLQQTTEHLEPLLSAALGQLENSGVVEPHSGSYVKTETYESFGRYSLKNSEGEYFERFSFFKPPLKGD